MKFLITSFLLILSVYQTYSQTTITFDDNSTNRLYTKLYAHVDYNQKIEDNARNSGKMDVHRVVLLFGYQFDRKTQFVTEIEVEHVKEIFVEQAFVKHRLHKNINLKAGLLLIPMGLVNEMHEPTFFYSVERPLIDKIIIPSTWREVGFGISGLLHKHSLKYQLYLVNNPLGYKDGSPTINASKGIRSARQKGAESIISELPGLSGQLEYFGYEGIKLGLSMYHGRTNTTLQETYSQDLSPIADARIDSSTVSLSMAALHTTFDRGPWTARFQYAISHFGDAANYNQYTQSDVPELMHGFYTLLAYDFLKNDKTTLSPFFRYSHINNRLRPTENQEASSSLIQNIYTTGINYKPNPGVVFKVDYQFYNKGNGENFRQFNAGIGVWF